MQVIIVPVNGQPSPKGTYDRDCIPGRPFDIYLPITHIYSTLAKKHVINIFVYQGIATTAIQEA